MRKHSIPFAWLVAIAVVLGQLGCSKPRGGPGLDAGPGDSAHPGRLDWGDPDPITRTPAWIFP